MKPMLLITAAVALGACATISAQPIRSDGVAGLRQPTRVGPLVVTPQSIVEDSRCPVNVRCIWAGRLVLRTRIDGAGWRETVDLELGKSYATHGTVIAFFSAQPSKIAGTVPSPPASLFGFEAL
jgi:hypothetical protein